MIDFAKTQPVAEERLGAEGGYTHRSPWECGNQEDGYLQGLDSLIANFQALVEAQAGSPYFELLDRREGA